MHLYRRVSCRHLFAEPTVSEVIQTLACAITVQRDEYFLTSVEDVLFRYSFNECLCLLLEVRYAVQLLKLNTLFQCQTVLIWCHIQQLLVQMAAEHTFLDPMIVLHTVCPRFVSFWSTVYNILVAVFSSTLLMH